MRLAQGYKSALLVAVPSLCLLVIGLSIVDEFGVGWDELVSRGNGLASVERAGRAGRADDTKPGVHVRDEHGTAFESLLILCERAAGYEYPRQRAEIFAMRHAATFISFVIGCAALLILARLLFGSWGLGLVAFLLLALHPRIFHHAFHNSSDIPFLSAFVVAHLTLQRLLATRRFRWALLHGVVCAFAIDVRIVGLMIVGITGMCVALARDEQLELPRSKRVRHKALLIAVYMVTTFVAMVAMWPFLWSAPLSRLAWALKSMSKIEWNHFVLYGDQYIMANNLPWHYNLVWIGITTSVIVLAAAVIGYGVDLVRLVRRPLRFAAERPFELALGCWLTIPLVAPIILGSVLFDGWRHHYFIYPALVLYCVGTGQQVHRRLCRGDSPIPRRKAWFMPGLAVIVIALSLFQLVSLHPLQNLYLNNIGQMIAGEGTKARYEHDYWGMAQRKGLEAIARREAKTSRPIHLLARLPIMPELKNAPGAKPSAFNTPLAMNRIYLPKAMRKRMILVGTLREADYFLGTYRWWRGEYPDSYGREIFALRVQGLKVLTVRARSPDTETRR